MTTSPEVPKEPTKEEKEAASCAEVKRVREKQEGRVEWIEQIKGLAREIVEANEVFTFSDIDPSAYKNHKAGEEQYGIWTTAIDVILQRLRDEGMKIKVVAGKTTDGTDNFGEIFALPAQSDDIVNDSIALRQVVISEAMPENLKNLISELKKWYETAQPGRS